MPVVQRALSASNRGSIKSMVRLNVFGVGLASLWTTVNTIILPERVGDLVSAETRGTILGIIGLVGIGAAALIQPVAGFLSDRSRAGVRGQERARCRRDRDWDRDGLAGSQVILSATDSNGQQRTATDSNGQQRTATDSNGGAMAAGPALARRLCHEPTDPGPVTSRDALCRLLK